MACKMYRYFIYNIWMKKKNLLIHNNRLFSFKFTIFFFGASCIKVKTRSDNKVKKVKLKEKVGIKLKFAIME